MTSYPPDQPGRRPVEPDDAELGGADHYDEWQPPPPAGPGYQPTQGYQPNQGYQPTPGYQPTQGYQSNQGYQPPVGYPPLQPVYQDQSARSRDGFSIAAFVLGLVAIFPLAIAFGIVGLVRTKRRVRKGRWMAVTGMVLGLAWIAAIIGLIAVAVGQQPSRSADGKVTKAGQASLTDLRIGDCLKLPASSGTGSMHTVRDVPCNEPHNSEVFASVTLSGSSYPGQIAAEQAALALCQAPGRTYIRTSKVRLTLLVLVPQRLSWNAGNHDARCVAVDPAGDHSGDIRQDR